MLSGTTDEAQDRCADRIAALGGDRAHPAGEPASQGRARGRPEGRLRCRGRMPVHFMTSACSHPSGAASAPCGQYLSQRPHESQSALALRRTRGSPAGRAISRCSLAEVSIRRFSTSSPCAAGGGAWRCNVSTPGLGGTRASATARRARRPANAKRSRRERPGAAESARGVPTEYSPPPGVRTSVNLDPASQRARVARAVAAASSTTRPAAALGQSSQSPVMIITSVALRA